MTKPTRTRSVNISLGPSYRRRLAAIARRLGITMADVVRRWIDRETKKEDR